MASAIPLIAPGLSPLDMLSARQRTPNTLAADTKAKAKVASQDFEAVFLNSMFQHMFTGIDGEGPFGGSGATGVWRSVLTDQYVNLKNIIISSTLMNHLDGMVVLCLSGKFINILK